MRKAVFSNTNGTLVIDPMDCKYGNPEFIQEYINRYGPEEFEKYTDADPAMKEHKKLLKNQMGIRDRLYSNVSKLLDALNGNGIELVIFAGASAEKSREIYEDLGVRIADAYEAIGELENRSDPRTFSKLGECIKEKYAPHAYITHRASHALASAEAWGKGLLSGMNMKNDGFSDLMEGDKVIGQIYRFNWDSLAFDWEIKKLIGFLQK